MTSPDHHDLQTASKLSWSMRDDDTLVALGSAGVGYVITVAGEEPLYTLHLPAGSYECSSLVRLMLDAQEIEDHAARKVAA